MTRTCKKWQGWKLLWKHAKCSYHMSKWKTVYRWLWNSENEWSVHWYCKGTERVNENGMSASWADCGWFRFLKLCFLFLIYIFPLKSTNETARLETAYSQCWACCTRWGSGARAACLRTGATCCSRLQPQNTPSGFSRRKKKGRGAAYFVGSYYKQYLHRSMRNRK